MRMVSRRCAIDDAYAMPHSRETIYRKDRTEMVFRRYGYEYECCKCNREK